MQLLSDTTRRGLESVDFDKVYQGFREKSSKPTAPHERADIINQFLELINSNRGTYKPATFPQINGQLRLLPKWELYAFLNECKKAKNPGAYFWWKMKQSRLSPSED